MDPGEQGSSTRPHPRPSRAARDLGSLTQLLQGPHVGRCALCGDVQTSWDIMPGQRPCLLPSCPQPQQGSPRPAGDTSTGWPLGPQATRPPDLCLLPLQVTGGIETAAGSRAHGSSVCLH